MGARITWLGHSTVAVVLDGTTLVTDPVLRRRIAHLRRDTSAATPPRPDAVLVSHLHYDHLDLPSLALIGRDVPLVVPRGAKRFLRRHTNVEEIEPGAVVEIGRVRVEAVEAVHDGRRRPFGAPVPALGFVLRGSRSIYFAGDTELFDGMGGLGPLDVGLIPVAGWGPKVGPGHLDPAASRAGADAPAAGDRDSDPLGDVRDRRARPWRPVARRAVRGRGGHGRAGRRRPHPRRRWDARAGRRAGVTTIDIDTPHGQARAHVHSVDGPRGWLVLGHGAGGGVAARDLVAAAEAATADGIAVALVEQPYRVAGRRSPAPARQLDAAWLAVVERLRDDLLGERPLVVGGRSSGARVACRTAGATGAAGVVCLAFPLQPPRRKAGEPPPSRLGELDAVTVPVLVVQGARDPFGMPPPGSARTVVQVNGDHSLRTDLAAVREAVASFLRGLLA